MQVDGEREGETRERERERELYQHRIKNALRVTVDCY